MRLTDADLTKMAINICDQCRNEYPNYDDDEFFFAVTDMCEETAIVNRLEGHEAQKLRKFCRIYS